jgi:hypothetical protein
MISTPCPRREDHRVARFQGDVRMLVVGDAPQGRASFALASGAEQEHLIARQIVDLALRNQDLRDVQIAGLDRRLDDPVHRAANQADPPSVGLGHLKDTGQTRHGAGEAGHRHPLLEPAYDIPQAPENVALRAGMTFDQRIGRIADHGQDPLVGQPP